LILVGQMLRQIHDLSDVLMRERTPQRPARLKAQHSSAFSLCTRIWSTLLKAHPLVDGTPLQRVEGTRNLLDIPLITGERLVFDGDAKEFSVG
jgi:hypothetical protein